MKRIAPIVLCSIIVFSALGCGPPLEVFSGTYSSNGKVTLTQTSPVRAEPYVEPFFRNVVIVPGDFADLNFQDEPCWFLFDVQDSVSATVMTETRCYGTVKGVTLSYTFRSGTLLQRGRTATVEVSGEWEAHEAGRAYSGTVTAQYQLTKMTK